MIKLGMEVDINETQELISNLTPNLTPSGKNGGLVFFPNLEESSDSGSGEDSSAPSKEEIKAMQGSTSANKKKMEDLVEGIKVPKKEKVSNEGPMIEMRSVNMSQYYDALEGPLASSPAKKDDQRSTKAKSRKPPPTDPSSSDDSHPSSSDEDDKYKRRKEGKKKKPPSTSSGSEGEEDRQRIGQRRNIPSLSRN